MELFPNDLAANGANCRQPWTLEKMASQCGMGITTFSKHCHDLINTGTVEYLDQCRLERAARQLKENPAQSVTEIAFENGFNSSQYFATLFRRRFHLTPRVYRVTK